MENRNYSREYERARRRKIRLFRRLFMLLEFVIIVILAVSLIIVSTKYNELKKETDSQNSGSVTSDSASSPTDEQLSMMAEVDKWYLKLVNPDNSVTKDFIDSVELTTILKAYRGTKESAKYLDSRVVEHYEAMCKAASEDGIALWACSAYRDYEYQQGLFNNRVTRFKNQGLSDEEAKAEAAKVVALPGG